MRLILAFFLIISIGATAACNTDSDEPAASGRAPSAAEETVQAMAQQAEDIVSSAMLSFPVPGQKLTQGQAIEVLSGSIDGKGIVKIELLVNDTVVNTKEVIPQPHVELVTKQVWTPSEAGSHVLQVRVYNPDDTVGRSQRVVVQVLSTTPEATRAGGIDPKPTATQVIILDAPSASPSPLPPTAIPTPDTPTLTVKAYPGLAVQTGPGPQYKSFDRLRAGDKAQIIGRNDIGAGPYWQISYPSAAGGVGWVSANPDNASASNTIDVPVVPAPSTPVLATPIPAATPTPSAGQANFEFGADRTRIQAGECTTLFWNADNVKAVFYNGAGVSGTNQRRQECPDVTTDFNLQVVMLDDRTETKAIRIEVEGVAAYPAFDMDLGERVDFDRNAHVSDDDDDGNDFQWIREGGERQFKKWDDDDDLELAPVGPVTLDIVKREDCEWAIVNLDVSEHIEPFTGLGACIRTDKGRLGKIRFDNNDDDDEVDIQWFLW